MQNFQLQILSCHNLIFNILTLGHYDIKYSFWNSSRIWVDAKPFVPPKDNVITISEFACNAICKLVHISHIITTNR